MSRDWSRVVSLHEQRPVSHTLHRLCNTRPNAHTSTTSESHRQAITRRCIVHRASKERAWRAPRHQSVPPPPPHATKCDIKTVFLFLVQTCTNIHICKSTTSPCNLNSNTSSATQLRPSWRVLQTSHCIPPCPPPAPHHTLSHPPPTQLEHQRRKT